MRFERIKLRNMGPFREVDIDLDAIPGRLIALTGANGAGKSTFAELLAGGMFRTTPTRGSLADLATARDSMLEVGVRNGRSYTLRHVVDCISKKGEAVVLSGSGATLTDAGKVREVDAWVESHLPSPEVLYSSTFSAQGSGGFLELRPADRKKVLLRVLGIERLEALAAKARENATKAKDALRIAETRLADEAARTTPLVEAENALDVAKTAAADAARELVEAEKRARDAERTAEAQTRALADRRDLTGRLERLDDAVAAARSRRSAARAKADMAPAIDTARAERPALAAEHAESVEKLAEAQARLRASRARAEQVDEAYKAQRRDRERLRAIESELSAARANLARLELTVTGTTEVEAARREVESLTETIRAERARLDQLRAQLSAAEAEHADRRAQAQSRERELAETHRRIDSLRAEVAHSAMIRDAAAELPELERSLADARNALPGLEAELDGARDARLSVSERRIGELRDVLDDIGDGAIGPESAPESARHALVDDDARLKAAAEAPARIAAMESDLAIAKRALAKCELRVSDTRRLADRLPALERDLSELTEVQGRFYALAESVADAQRTIETATSAIAHVRSVVGARAESIQDAEGRLAQARRVASRAEDIARAHASAHGVRDAITRLESERADLATRPTAEHPDSKADIDAAERAVDDATGRRTDASAALTRVDTVLADADVVARAAAEVDAATREIDRVMADADAIRTQIAALPPVEALDVDSALAKAEQAHSTSKSASGRVAVAERTLEQAREATDRLLGLRVDVDRETVELADWTRLGQDLGKDGIQALEIDAAGPEVTAIANDLLHSCVSRRWTIEVRTQRTSADGKKQIEGCDVIVIDTERGREGEAETFSGGERVLIGEALSLALSVLACRRIGVDGPTLVRDESGAALDAANGRAYVAMLRRAAELIGASHVLYVSHSPELQELADARIHIEDGRAVVIA